MNPRASNIIGFIIGIVISGILGYFLFKITNLVISKIDKLDANIVVAILAGSFTITGFFITRYLEKKKLIEQQIRDQKLPIYEEFVDFIFKVFENTKNSKNQISEVEMQKFFWKLNRKSILWLSDNTLKSYIIWKNSLSTHSSNGEEKEIAGTKLLLEFEKLLIDFRKDIGHKSSNIKQGDILSLFITDLNKYITKI